MKVFFCILNPLLATWFLFWLGHKLGHNLGVWWCLPYIWTGCFVVVITLTFTHDYFEKKKKGLGK